MMMMDYKYKIPEAFINCFHKEAAKNKSLTSKRHLETLAFLIGVKNENEITATDLIFPKQRGNSALVVDEGMSC